MRKASAFAAAFVASLAGIVCAGETEARACGGCFVPQVESTVVNDHRMVFAVSQKHTILWDQIEYSGDPKEFAWVLPVGRGTVVELSRDEWIAALDSTTQPQILQPPPPSSGDDGCDGVGCGSTTRSAFAADMGLAGPAVQVVSQSVVGPYETVTLRSEDAQALQSWLSDNGYAIPPGIEPVIAAYTAQGLDFIALKLRPGQGVRAMKPVRIVTPGADATLPLRMVAAGVGANVGLTLFVISEGRYRPQNFPEVTLDDSKLVWRNAENRSNYQELSLATMAAAPGGRGWLVEYSNRPTVSGYNSSGGSSSGFGPPISGSNSLYNAYYSQCIGDIVPPGTSPGSPGVDAGGEPADPIDAGEPDAGDGPADAATDAPTEGETYGDAGGSSSGDPGTSECNSVANACCSFDDLELAIDGMNRNDVWVTRLRANLPVAALNEDLRLEAHPKQEPVSNVHQAKPESSPNASIAPLRRGRIAGSATLTLGVAFLVSRILRRRRSA
jgi:Uncharacterized protein conserved in bacteria (DUF2330)